MPYGTNFYKAKENINKFYKFFDNSSKFPNKLNISTGAPATVTSILYSSKYFPTTNKVLTTVSYFIANSSIYYIYGTYEYYKLA